jgi:putative spermidine/putrescine transport system permease protein
MSAPGSARVSVVDDPTVGPTGARRPPRLVAARRRKQTILRFVVVIAVMVFFMIPLISMLDFSTRLLSGARTGKAWSSLLHLGSLAQTDSTYEPLWDGLKASLWLVVLTVAIMVVLLVPTMTWVRLRAPALRRPMEFICLLPLTIPAIVLVVGLAPIYRFIARTTGSTASVWLCLVYVVLVLPFAYRALDAGLAAIDVKTLAEAARGLGAGWATIILRIVMPNIRTAIVSACFLAVALVFGEFTVAYLLSRDNLQTGIFLVSQDDGRLAVAMALVALVLGFLLLLALSFLSGRQRDRRGD